MAMYNIQFSMTILNYHYVHKDKLTFLCCDEMNKNILNIFVTFWDMFDEGGGPSGDPTDEGSRPASQTLIWQAEEVRHTVTDAPHQAGRTAQDLQRPHHPAWDTGTNTGRLHSGM